MASLLVESFCNDIQTKTEGILKDHSNLKKLIQVLIDNKINSLNMLYSLSGNYNFTEFGTDLLTEIKNNSASLKMLKGLNYQETSKEKYNYENFNNVESFEKIHCIVKSDNKFIESFKMTSKDIDKEYIYFFKEHYVLFTPTISNSPAEYYFDFKDYNIIDFKIDSTYFVFMILEKNAERFLVISHLGKEFIQYNVDDAKLDTSQCFNYVKIDNNISSIEHYEGNIFYVMDIYMNLYKMSLNKKYYFKDGESIFFNHIGDAAEYKESFIDVRQNNFLNMYNVLNYLGLNDFKMNELKISTKEHDLFNDLFKNKFDNTLNGGLNYFNSLPSIYFNDNMFYSTYKKDYHISISDEYYSINGNFKYKDFVKGTFKIEITPNEVFLYKKEEDRYLMIDSAIIPTYKEFYFCNLKFTFKKYEFPNSSYIFELSSYDPYVFNQYLDPNYKLYSLPNNPKVIENLLNKSKHRKKIKAHVEFDGKSIIFHNTFLWKEQRFLFGSFFKNISTNEIIDISGFKSYFFNKPYDLKNNKLYSRSKGRLIYTMANEFKYDLINSKGYITKFWSDNQNKTLYFKITNSGISIVENKLESDYYCHIPPIKEFITYNDNSFNNITIEINDSLEVNRQKTDSLMITNKFHDSPLFYKVFIECENPSNIKIFDNDKKEIVKYVTEEFKNGYIFYFDIDKNKKYYYDTEDSKYNYFEPLLAHENIDFEYKFDDTCYIELSEPVYFSTLTLKSKKTITEDVSFDLFIYNEASSQTNKISLTSKELNTKFELELTASRFFLQVNSSKYSAKDFYIVEDSNNSLIINDNIIFFKNDRSEIVYIANKTDEIDYNSLDYTKFKVDTYYQINDGKFIDSIDGIFIITSPNQHQIALINNKDNIKYIETEVFVVSSVGKKDDFYIKNFKNPGTFYTYKNITPSLLSTSTNNYFDFNKLGEENE